MITRRLEQKITNRLREMPSVALMGPRQVGKTTLAIDIAESVPSVYLDLENRLAYLELNPIDLLEFAGEDQKK